MDAHASAVAHISSTIRAFHSQRKPYRIYHGSTNSTRASTLTRSTMVDTSSLTNILSISTSSLTAVIEPNVPMDDLVASLLPHGLLPPVVMEFPGITVGGGYSGTSAESSSFRHGFFDRNVNWVEIVLPTGEVIKASREENSDLLYGAASSFGTLGVVTLLELQLIPAQPYVEVTYHPITQAEEVIPKIQTLTADPTNDYLDGIMFSKSTGVLVSGKLTSTRTTPFQTFTKPTDPWFYLHARSLLSRNKLPYTETVPINDYLFRYDRGGFWVGAYAFKYFFTPFNRLTRYLLDYFMHTRVMYHALHKSGHSNIYVIQDVAVPYTGTVEFLNFLDQNFGIYPLWLCPLKMKGNRSDSPHGLLAEVAAKDAPEFLLNFGVWGPSSSRGMREFIDQNRRLEQKVDSLGGKKWLYAQTYYTEDEFWRIYNKKEYDSLREKYGAEYLPSVYDKVKTDLIKDEERRRKEWGAWLRALFWSIWPLSGLYGVLAVLIGGRDYLLPRKEKKT